MLGRVVGQVTRSLWAWTGAVCRTPGVAAVPHPPPSVPRHGRWNAVPEWLRSRLNPNNNKKRPTDKPPLSGGSKGGGGDSKGPPHKKPPTWVWGVGGAVALLSLFGGSLWQDTPEITFQRLKDDLLDKGVVSSLVIRDNKRVDVYVKEPNGIVANEFHFRIGGVDAFERKLENAQRDLGFDFSEFVSVVYHTEPGLLVELLKLAPTLLLIGSWIYLSRSSMGGAGQRGGGPGGIFQIGKSNATLINKDDKVSVRFADVAGLDEAKQEIMEFVSFLKDPSKYNALGAKIPKGALLVGPPGTGKTMLAKATAGEATVPFFSVSGSDFLEMFVGVGPSRVRDLFKQARANAPCIVFVDEIDAVGRKRGRGGFGGGNDERENTLNQMLVEMDGFTPSTGVVVFAGTNRADILDPALMRPGRFDRQIAIDLPDIKGREAIFLVHLKPIKTENKASTYAKRLASLTPGLSGADIANICNEAALVAAREGAKKVNLVHFEKAIDRSIGGLERKSRPLSPFEKRVVAYHEAGHAVVGWFLKHADPLLKATIIPRSGGALGFAQYLPKEQFIYTFDALMDRMCTLLGGRVSEKIFFDHFSTGASDDLQKVTQLAYSQVMLYGMSPEVGPLSFPPDQQSSSLDKPYSEETSRIMDGEVKRLVDSAYDRTMSLLLEKRQLLEQVAELLMEKEIINQTDMVRILGERVGGYGPHSEYTSPESVQHATGATKEEEEEEVEVEKRDGSTQGTDTEGGTDTQDARS